MSVGAKKGTKVGTHLLAGTGARIRTYKKDKGKCSEKGKGRTLIKGAQSRDSGQITDEGRNEPNPALGQQDYRTGRQQLPNWSVTYRPRLRHWQLSRVWKKT